MKGRLRICPYPISTWERAVGGIMNTKGIFAFVLCTAACFFGCESSRNQNGSMMGHSEQNMQACAHMSEEEQAFAQKLRPYNQMMFCEQLNESQRMECMRLARQGNYQYGRGKYYTPDEAVEKVSRQTKKTGRSYRRSC